MKILTIKGRNIKPQKISNKFYAITCGEEGRGRKLGFIPLCKELQQEDELIKEYDVIKTQKGNLLIIPETKEEGLIIITDWYGGFRGGISSNIHELSENNYIQILQDGATAEGTAGRMGGENQYIFKVNKSCKVYYKKLGRVYGNPREWIVDIDLENRKVEEYPAVEDIDLEY